MQRGETYQDGTGRLFRVEKVNPLTVVVKENGGTRLVNRWLLEQEINNGETKLRGKGKKER